MAQAGSVIGWSVSRPANSKPRLWRRFMIRVATGA